MKDKELVMTTLLKYFLEKYKVGAKFCSTHENIFFYKILDSGKEND